MILRSIFFTLALTGTIRVAAQILTQEDSLTAGLVSSGHTTVISGYGQLKVEYDARYQTAEASLTRNVLFLGHKFSDEIYFFSEMEIENARVEGGEPSGEISMEQLFLKFNLNRDIYLQAGLFLPRIGIINENHLPTTFNGNDRTFLETSLIPATWREIGLGIYGNLPAVQGLNYSFAVTNGLDAASFTNGTGVREGRQEGSNATAANIALSGSLLYYLKAWRLQASAYYGGSAGLTHRVADSLQLDAGLFGTPVVLTEVDAQYQHNRFSFRVLGAVVKVPDAFAINRAYASNTPSTMLGAYAEMGYDLIHNASKRLTLFLRAEYLDLNAGVPVNGIRNGINEKRYTVMGLTYRPVAGVIIKADYVARHTGERNDDLIVNPFPQALPYYTDNGFFNLGLGYSF